MVSREAPEALEALADDYLRLLSRTRPWDRRSHGDALEAFLRWVREARGEDLVARAAEDDAAGPAATRPDPCPAPPLWDANAPSS